MEYIFTDQPGTTLRALTYDNVTDFLEVGEREQCYTTIKDKLGESAKPTGSSEENINTKIPQYSMTIVVVFSLI